MGSCQILRNVFFHSVRDLKKTYRASLDLKLAGDLFYLVGGILTFLFLLCFFDEINTFNASTAYKGNAIYVFLALIILSMVSRRIPSSVILKIFAVIQIVLVLTGIVFTTLAVRHSRLGQIFTESLPSNQVEEIFSEVLGFSIAAVLLLIAVFASTTLGVILRNSRSSAARIFLVSASALLTICGLHLAVIGLRFGALGLVDTATSLCIAAAFLCILTGRILFITGFSRVKNNLFGYSALSHKQLRSALKQMKQGVPNENLVIDEDRDDISDKKGYIAAGWIALAVVLSTEILIVVVECKGWGFFR